MPIKPENVHRYPADWQQIRERILDRAGNCCERCKAPNRTTIWRGSDDTYMIECGDVFDADTGEHLGSARGSEYPVKKIVRIVLTIAHLDHVPEHCDEANLQALCQRCHLRHDQQHHIETAAATRRSRKAIGELFP